MNCHKIQILDLHSFNGENFQNMRNIFANCYNLEKVIFDFSFNALKLLNLEKAFMNCYSLTSIEIQKNKMSLENVYSMREMFSGCCRMTSLDLSFLFFNNKKKEKNDFSKNCDIKNIFNNCSSSLKKINFPDVKIKSKDMQNLMKSDCGACLITEGGKDSCQNSINVGIIVGLIFVGVVVIGGVVAFLIYLIKKRGKQLKNPPVEPNEMDRNEDKKNGFPKGDLSKDKLNRNKIDNENDPIVNNIPRENIHKNSLNGSKKNDIVEQPPKERENSFIINNNDDNMNNINNEINNYSQSRNIANGNEKDIVDPNKINLMIKGDHKSKGPMKENLASNAPNAPPAINILLDTIQPLAIKKPPKSDEN